MDCFTMILPYQIFARVRSLCGATTSRYDLVLPDRRRTSVGCTGSAWTPRESTTPDTPDTPDTSATSHDAAARVVEHCTTCCATFHYFHVSPLTGCHHFSRVYKPILTFCPPLCRTYVCVHALGGFPEIRFRTCTE